MGHLRALNLVCNIISKSAFIEGATSHYITSNFTVPPGQWFIVAIYPCAFTCGCSFYCAKSSGHLDQF